MAHTNPSQLIHLCFYPSYHDESVTRHAVAPACTSMSANLLAVISRPNLLKRNLFLEDLRARLANDVSREALKFYP